MSKPTEFHLWWITDKSGQRRMTTYRMDRETALKRYPDAQPVPASVEIRYLPESSDEWSTEAAPSKRAAD